MNQLQNIIMLSMLFMTLSIANSAWSAKLQMGRPSETLDCYKQNAPRPFSRIVENSPNAGQATMSFVSGAPMMVRFSYSVQPTRNRAINIISKTVYL